ncbi:hypothetical protein IKQ26_04480 [bacterium]|nr:hypothetical protein [bacterium]
MRKIIVVFFALFLTTSLSYGDDVNYSDAFQVGQMNSEKAFSGQKAITDSKFKKTIEMLKERQLSAKQKKERNRVVPLSPAASEEHLREFSHISDGDDISHTLTVMIPVSAYTDYGQLITPGFYKLSCKKLSNNQYVLQLTQDTDTVFTVKAKSTPEDLNQETINFCNAELSEENKTIKLIYGNLGLNLVGYIYIK